MIRYVYQAIDIITPTKHRKTKFRFNSCFVSSEHITRYSHIPSFDEEADWRPILRRGY